MHTLARWSLAVLCTMLLAPVGVLAQSASPTPGETYNPSIDPADFSTPQSTTHTFR